MMTYGFKVFCPCGGYSNFKTDSTRKYWLTYQSIGIQFMFFGQNKLNYNKFSEVK